MATRNEGQRLEELTSRYFAEGFELWDRYLRTLGWDSTRSTREPGPNVSDAPRRMARFARDEGGRLASQLVRLNVDYASSLLDLGIEFSSRVLDAMLDTGSRRSPGGARADGSQPIVPPRAAEAPSREHAEIVSMPVARRPAPPRRTLLLRGRPGSTPEVQFKVSNRREHDHVEVSFEISEFIAEDGRPAVRGDVDVTPTKFVLGHGEERMVTCTLLMPQQFEHGTRYLGLLRVIGFEDLSIGLVVELEPPDSDPAIDDEAAGDPETT